MKITPTLLKNCYTLLTSSAVFSRKRLPTAEQVIFKVSHDLSRYGSYRYDGSHTITISGARCGHLITVMKTMAHEIIHLSRYRTDDWAKHDTVFKQEAIRVATEFGFDPFEL